MAFVRLQQFVLNSLAIAAVHAQLKDPLYQRIPVGQIKPTGWSLTEARAQADGLVGTLRAHSSYVKGSIWTPGGSVEYSEMQESGPYWFNGQVALAFQLNDKRLKAEVREFLDYTLDNQQDDGWLGPEPSIPGTHRLTWPRYLFLLGAIQYAEVDPSQFTRITDAMHKFADLVHDVWLNNEEGGLELGNHFHYQSVRWMELIYSLQWLLDNDPRDRGEKLVETMTLLRDQGFSWKDDWFTEEHFKKDAATEFIDQTHGVNQAIAIKAEALAWRMTGDESDKESTFHRVELLDLYHGSATGAFTADEHLGGLNPSRGTELCAVVEYIFSLSTVYQIFGNNSVADRAEKLHYNAHPAALLADWKSHQYDQQVNQIWAKEMDPHPWGHNTARSNIFGFEPHYPCCTANHGQTAPKFWANSFVIDPADESLVHVLLGPTKFEGKVGSANVKVDVDTAYPFGSVLRYVVTTDKDLKFKVRIPDWAIRKSSTIAVNKIIPSRITPDASTSLQLVSLKKGINVVTVHLDSEVRIEKRPNDAVSIHRGALMFALELSYNTTTTPGLRSTIATDDVRRIYPDAPQEYLESYDYETDDNVLLPTEEWRLAINPKSIRVVDLVGPRTSMPLFKWDPKRIPLYMTVDACQIEWGLWNGTAALPPQSPNECQGKVFKAKLVPYGAAKLRLGEIPTFEG